MMASNAGGAIAISTNISLYLGNDIKTRMQSIKWCHFQ